MAVRIRLSALPDQNPEELRFALAWAAPAEAEEVPCAPARLDYGDGTAVDLGLLCPPTAVTWHEQRQFDLGLHRYAGPGTYAAYLRWGDAVAEAVAAPGVRAVLAAQAAPPVVALFALAAVAAQPLQRLVKLRVEGLASGQRLRLDGGAAQVRWLSEADGGIQAAEFLLDYAKPGPYHVTLDALDADGFWLATLAESPLELAFPEETQVAAETAAPPQPELSVTLSATEALAEPQPWLPYRYVRPTRYDVYTYSAPGGGATRRAVNPGFYLSVRAETSVNGQRWFRTAQGDWIAARVVTFVSPSELRGVLLGEPIPPPPPPSGTRRGVVTAAVLNVRARPGVSTGNPPVATLRAGTEVTIYETQSVGAETWYRIGEDRWVSGQWVRLLDAARSPVEAVAAASPWQLPVGWVRASSLNVRARPGVTANNPPVGRVVHNQPLSILEQQTVAGAKWYRIGERQWVAGSWVGVAHLKSRPASIGSSERWAGVCLAEQTLVAYEGDRPVYAALIASGLPGTPTVQGIFRTWLRLTTGKMVGPGYYLEDVTWTCYFYSGYALHTAYWHDAFGRPRSRGCVNMSPHDAWWVFQWSAAGGKNSPTVYVYWA